MELSERARLAADVIELLTSKKIADADKLGVLAATAALLTSQGATDQMAARLATKIPNSKKMQ